VSLEKNPESDHSLVSGFGEKAPGGLDCWVRELLDEGAFQCDPMETQPWLF